jgi:hypothetical protein
MQHTWTVFLLVGLFCSTCAMAQEANTQSATQLRAPAVHAFKKNSIVYISDFELDAQNVKVDKGSVVGEMRPGVVERPRKREQRDPRGASEETGQPNVREPRI